MVAAAEFRGDDRTLRELGVGTKLGEYLISSDVVVRHSCRSAYTSKTNLKVIQNKLSPQKLHDKAFQKVSTLVKTHVVGGQNVFQLKQLTEVMNKHLHNMGDNNASHCAQHLKERLTKIFGTSL